MKLLDLIFPKYCVNCKKYGNFLCTDCFSRLSFDTKNIYQFKYKPYLSSLSAFLAELIYESLIQNEEFNRILHEFPPKADRQDDIFLVPIPLSSNRFKNRGY